MVAPKRLVSSRSRIVAVALAILLIPAVCNTGFAGTISFSTFVSQSDIASAENGQTNVIGFNFAGNKFVGSLYFGPNNLQLYSTDLTGHNVQKFGSPMTNGFGGEVVVAGSLGQEGFAKGDVYAGAGDQIFHYTNSGGSPTLFATVPNFSTIRQIFFDPGNSFGGDMLVTTTSGEIYKIDAAGNVSNLANTGEDTEGVDIATTAWGSFAGYLMVASEGSGLIRLISPSGAITVVNPNDRIPEAETVSFVPLNLNSADPLQGFYVADYPQDIQFVNASQFTSQNLQGDAIVTSEFGSNSPIWDVHYNGGSSFTISQFSGNLPLQSEDGIFVSEQRLSDISGTPEPATLMLLGQGGVVALGFAWRRRRKLRLAAV